ncbi:MAG: hypothetical protein B5M53_02065 [Candidatus Cloacimonas sp. 4484_209]|nr:MAG: hypothetical protein B5M53_02065 [Candidatus Cloacimonas sp. 4484_209]
MKRITLLVVLISCLSFSLMGLSDKPLLSVNEKESVVSLQKGKLYVSISFTKRLWRSVTGDVIFDVIDANDNVILSRKEHIRFYKKTMRVKFSQETNLNLVELLTCRLRITFQNKTSRWTDIIAMSQLVDKLELIVFGQNRLISGSKASVRIVTLNYRGRKPIKNAFVTITLKGEKLSKKLFAGKTNANGNIDASFFIPDLKDKNLSIIVSAKTNIGKDKVSYNVTTRKAYSIYLITDKPVYQPGQIIHIRTLTLKKPSLKSVTRTPVKISIEDAKGNKVFKRDIRTDKFGVASCDFQLANELNTGDYRIRAEITNSSAEKVVNVKRYVLPKFEITLRTNKDYYLPSETLKGDLNVKYFFGKPVSGGKVKITLSKFDVGFSSFQEIKGETDSSGNYHFDVRLPSHFVGTPLEQGKAFIKIDVEVTDKAEHKEKLTDKRIVAKSDLNVVIIPESGTLVPGLKNIIYVMSTYPDGTPAKTNIILKSGKVSLTGKTDNSGIAEFLIEPSEKNGIEILASAKDAKGATGEAKVHFSYNENLPSILLRTDKGLYRVGNTMKLTVLSSKKKGVVYIDIIKDKQTILTKSVRITRGIGRLSVSLNSELSGTLWLHAYTVAAGKEIMRDTKVVYVNPANDLTITIVPDKKIYRPGEKGKLRFSVKDKRGHPVISALGISIVDKSVFALTEMQPGLEKVYFTLEKELMHPKYEIHNLSPKDIVMSGSKQPIDKIKEKAAKVLFASISELSPFSVKEDNAKQIDETIYNKYSQKVWNDVYRLRNAINKFYNKEKHYPTTKEGFQLLIKKGYLDWKDILDPWEEPYEIITTTKDLSSFNILSYGPDKMKGTADDISTQYYSIHFPERNRWKFFEGQLAGGRMKKGLIPEAAIPPNVVEEDKLASSPTGKGKEGGIRIRQYFPETFIFKPALITNRKGVAQLPLKWPDSITEWRISTTASTINGSMGSTTKGMKVFQDFFVDLDLPVSLTQNDIVSVPVALYNYLKGEQKITLKLKKDDWYELLDDAKKIISIGADEVSVVYFRLRAKKIGKHSFTVTAVGSKMSDAVKRDIEIIPDGKKFEEIVSGRLEGKISKTVYIPEKSVDGSGKIFVRIFPGLFSQVVEGMESMFGMPYGCFEQTSSVTYPNILVLDYLRSIKKITPEIEMKAEQYINVGYQRLLSYEVKGGGFEWFGNAPANRILTAYGLMEFNDMAKVFETDPGIVPRTQRWLIGQQNKDGSFTPDKSYLHQNSWNRIQKNRTLPTAYILWALAETGYKSNALKKAAAYIEHNLGKEEDPYILAICANAFVSYEPKAEITRKIIESLVSKRIEEKGLIYWESKIPTFTYAKGKGADIEATALATYALIKYNGYSSIVNKAISFLIKAKYPNGTWGSTQATVLALRCLLASLKGSQENVDATITVEANGKQKEKIRLNKDNADMMFLIDLSKEIHNGENDIAISLSGKGNPMYEIVSRYYMPWELVSQKKKKEILSIDVHYDKTTLYQNDIVTCRVKVKNNIPASANMVIVDLGIPPGFQPESEDLNKLVGKQIKKYNLTARQIILYIDRIDYGKPLQFTYRLKAKFPIKAKSPTSRVYKYYQPEVKTVAEPVEIEVKG